MHLFSFCLFQCMTIFRAQATKSFKEKRYGYGGQKKRSKYNDSKSSADVEGFNRKVHQPQNSNKRKVKL